MGWLYLVVAGLFEVGFATCLKLSDGFSRFWPVVGFLVFSLLSLGFLTKAMNTIPLGTAYAAWTGLGAFGTAVVGLLYFRDPAGFWRLFFLATLLLSVIGLKAVSEH